MVQTDDSGVSIWGEFYLHTLASFVPTEQHLNTKVSGLVLNTVYPSSVGIF